MIRGNHTHERWVALFLLGALLFLPPLLQVFNRPDRLLGVPVLYLYIFLAWAALILIAATIARRMTLEDSSVQATGINDRGTDRSAPEEARDA